jgi:hypothetical protein
MLEQQQASLVAGLQELYRRIRDGPGWSGPPLNCDANGHPSTDDLLNRLGILDHSSSKGEQLESRQDTVHFERGKGQNAPAPMQAQDVCDASSESSDSSIVPARSVDYVTSQMWLDPASLGHGTPVKPGTSSAPWAEPQLTVPGNVDPVVLQEPRPHHWVADEARDSDDVNMMWSVCFGNVFEDEDAMWPLVFQSQPNDCMSYCVHWNSHYNHSGLYLSGNTPDILLA